MGEERDTRLFSPPLVFFFFFFCLEERSWEWGYLQTLSSLFQSMSLRRNALIQTMGEGLGDFVACVINIGITGSMSTKGRLSRPFLVCSQEQKARMFTWQSQYSSLFGTLGTGQQTLNYSGGGVPSVSNNGGGGGLGMSANLMTKGFLWGIKRGPMSSESENACDIPTSTIGIADRITTIMPQLHSVWANQITPIMPQLQASESIRSLPLCLSCIASEPIRSLSLCIVSLQF